MFSNLSFTEMNQAVPGSFVCRPMESPLECEVPSPSQWSDPCRSPPSLHSPPHYPNDLDKFKEEPFSPRSFCATLTPSPPLYLSPPASLMSRDGAESSINLADLVAENKALVHHVQQHHQPAVQAPQIIENLLQQQRPQHLLPKGSFSEGPPPLTLQGDKDSFLDSLVDIKQEAVDPESSLQQSVAAASSPPRPALQSSTSFSPRPLVTPSQRHLLLSPGGAGPSGLAPTQAPSAPGSTGVDFDLKKTVEMALDYYKQELQNVSSQLSIPLDPSSWTVENVRAWLSYQAAMLTDLPPLRLDNFNLTGKQLMSLTESQFRRLFPRGGDLFYAQFEILKEAVTKSLAEHSATLFRPQIVNITTTSLSPQQPCQSPSIVQSTIIYQQQILHRIPPDSQSTFLTDQKPIDMKDNKVPTSDYQTEFPSQTYLPTSSQQGYKTPDTLASLLAPSPSILTTSSLHSTEAPSSTTSSVSQSHVSLPVTSAHLPTVVLQAGSQTSLHTQKESASTTTPTISSHQIKAEKDAPHHLTSHTYLEEASLNVLMQGGELPSTSSTTPQSTTTEPHKELADSEDEVDMEAGSSTTGATRSGTHIHLWQFLKELLQQPQHYGSCIRWLDRPKGIFKIEDSVRVARLWGKRKNRPAMNYDKLSRSIRQYYKKGIMKKTERSQRLVYQFCHPYSL